MKPIPTAEEFLKDLAITWRDEYESQQLYADYVTPEMLIAFTRSHVQAALEAAAEKATAGIMRSAGSGYPDRPEIHKDSIINAYPLTNIK